MTSKLTLILNRVLLLRVCQKVQGMALFPGQDTMWLLSYSCGNGLWQWGNGSNTTEWNDNGMEECNGVMWHFVPYSLCSSVPSVTLHSHYTTLSLSVCVCVCVYSYYFCCSHCLFSPVITLNFKLLLLLIVNNYLLFMFKVKQY